MKKLIMLLVTSLVFSLNACAIQNPKIDAQAEQAIQTFPQASKTQQKNIILLPKLTAEELAKIEIIATKAALVDCNDAWFKAKFNQENLTGYGYNYYTITDVSDLFATRKGCATNEQSTKAVSVILNNNILNYNSQLPVIIYAPKEITIQYRLWTTDNHTKPAIIK